MTGAEVGALAAAKIRRVVTAANRYHAAAMDAGVFCGRGDWTLVGTDGESVRDRR